MLLDADAKYGRFEETYLVEAEGSRSRTRCFVTQCFLFKHSQTQIRKTVSASIVRQHSYSVNNLRMHLLVITSNVISPTD